MLPIDHNNQELHSAICSRYQALIWASLDAELFRSAVFYAERYWAFDHESHGSRHLYCQALLKAGQTHQALHYVTAANGFVPCGGCDELRAKCFTALGRWREAKEALEQTIADQSDSSSVMTSRSTTTFPDEGVLHCRAGIMAMNGKQYDNANVHFRKAIVSNPMLWEAVEGLCALGTIPTTNNMFPPRPQPIKRGPNDPSTAAPAINAITHPFAPSIPIPSGGGFFTPSPAAGNFPTLFKQPWRQDSNSGVPFRINPATLQHFNDTPTFNDTSFSRPLVPGRLGAGVIQPPQQPPPAPTLAPATLPAHPAPSHPAPPHRPLSSAEETGPAPKKPRSTTRSKVVGAAAAETKVIVDDDTKKEKARARPALHIVNFISSSLGQSKVAPARTALGAAKADREATRRSTRLLGGNTRSNVKSPTRDRRRATTRERTMSHESETADDGTVESVGSPPPTSDGSAAPPTAPAWTAEDEKAATDEYWAAMADNAIYDLMRHFADATRALAMYDTDECRSLLDKLPAAQQRSAWVMVMLGKVHYERTEYVMAERAFVAVRQLQPYRVWDMEVYSTLLWYLQKPVQLSFLAQELLAIDPKAPQAWIAVGNTFSAQRERSQAITCFRRAIQLDPGCAYAHTLMGHESVDEAPDQAMTFFQAALRADPRHYNAWYGLGSMYMKRNKLRLAEYHFRQALNINGNNAVILGCMGIACQRRGDRSGAFAHFDDAIRRNPDNALVRYHRAKLYIATREYKKAVVDLECLRDSAPEESNVIFQLAKVYRLLGDELRSAQLLAAARDISPKSIGKIRKLLETVKDDEAADEEMDEG